MTIDEYEASLEKDKQGNEPNDDTEDQDDFGDIFDMDDEDELDSDNDDESDDEKPNDDEDNTDDQDDQPNDDTKDNQDEPKDDKDKKVQTPEENAKFAEQRRQQQLEQQLQDRMKESPEYKVAQMLASRYGVTTEQMLQQLQESELQQRAEKENVPVEVLKRQQEQDQRIQEQNLMIQQMAFQQWQSRISQEMQALKPNFPMLNDEDIKAASDYMFRVGNVDLPLEEAVYAVHGKKIAEGLREQAKQDALAELGGRKKSPIAPQGGKPNPTTQLSAEEKYVAKMMGISDKDYLKYKRQS